MSVLLNWNKERTAPGKGGNLKGIGVRCPKCQEMIQVTGIGGSGPIRCEKCAYPLILRSDLLLIVAACKKANAHQTDSAVRLLTRLADYLPEAGTALGAMAKERTLPLSDLERWNRLCAAYAGGDESAREWLNAMCQANPATYRQRACGGCGAPKYYVRRQEGKTLCSYCQSTD